MSKLNNAPENKVVEMSANNVGELKGLLSASRAQGLKVAIIKIPVRLFAIDTAYQTEERTKRSLNYLINNYSEEKLLPVIGVPHDEEGKVYLVDGYGRWQMALKLGLEYLECMIILNAPTEEKARRKYEAEQFAFQNVGTVRVTPLQRHGAYECMEYEPVMIINRMKDKYGFKLSHIKGWRDAGVLGSYSSVFYLCKVDGEECADYVFNICNKAGFHLKANGYATYVIQALRDVWRYYPINREEASTYLSTWLRDKEPAYFKAKAVSRYGLLDQRTACSLYLEDLLVDNLNFNHVRHVEGKSVEMLKTA